MKFSFWILVTKNANHIFLKDKNVRKNIMNKESQIQNPCNYPRTDDKNWGQGEGRNEAHFGVLGEEQAKKSLRTTGLI